MIFLYRSSPWLRLLRPQTMAATVALYLLPAAVVHDPWSSQFLVWGIIGVLMHLFGFVSNELFDRHHDARRQYLQHKPLVARPQMATAATAIVLAALVAIFVLAVTMFTPVVTVLIIGATLAAFAYNALSKVTPVWGPSLLAAWGALSVLAVASSGEWPKGIAPASMLVVYTTLAILYQVNLGFLKDPGEAPERRVLVTLDVLAIGMMLVAAYATTTLLTYPAIALTLLISVIGTRGGLYLHANRPAALRMMALHEFGGYLTAVCLVLPALRWQEAAALAIVPVVWYLVVNRMVYGAAMTPGV